MKPTAQKKISSREYKYLIDALVRIIVLAPNAFFSQKDIAGAIIGASVENTFVESFCKHMRNKNVGLPTGNDVFYHLGKKGMTMKSIYAAVDSAIAASITKAGKFLNLRSPLCVAVDFNEIPFYGEVKGELAEWVVGCKSQKGTNWCFRFITSHITVMGKRFTVAAIPVHSFDSVPCLLERLIRITQERVRIRYLFLDRGFYSVDCINVLLKSGMKFVMPVIKHNAKRPEKDMLRLLRAALSAGNHRFAYTLGNRYNYTEFTVVAVEGKDGGVFGFATNTKLPAGTIGNWYKKRWGIETGYRVKKEFKAKTCARMSVSARLLINMLPFALYNTWVLINAAIRCLACGRRFLSGCRSYVTAYEFCREFEDILKGIP